MRVLLVSHHFLPHVGGLEVLVHYEIEAIVAAGHQVVLVTSNMTGNAQTPQYSDAVELFRIPTWNFLEEHYNLPYPIFSPRLVVRLWRELSRCDVIHIHGFMFHSSLVTAVMGRLRGKPIILTDHGGIQQFDSRIKSVLARLGAHTVGRITANCAGRLVAYNLRITTLLEQLTGRKGQSLFLPNPVDSKLFYPIASDKRAALRNSFGWPGDRPKILFVGRLTKEKGVPLLLECIHASRYDVVFCGSGDASILGKLPRKGVEFLPPRPQAELVKLYQAADVLVVPSKAREGFPLVVQEGLACGIKVILGYETGFEPYRALPGLIFCTPVVADMQRAIDDALLDPSKECVTGNHAGLIPQPMPWIQRLYAGMLDFSAIKSELRS